MNICIDITKEFDSVINYDFFFDSAPMYPVIFLNHFDDTMYHYELGLMNFGLNISDRMGRMFLQNKKTFGNIIDCSFEFKSLLIYGKSQIAIDGVKGLDIRYSNENETLYYHSAYQVEEGDFDFVCGGFSSFSEHFVRAHIIAGHDAKATITFSSEDYLLMSSDTPDFQKMASKRQTPFKIENKNIFNTIINKFSQTPGKMFDMDFYNKYFRTNFDSEFNTTMAIKSEMKMDELKELFNKLLIILNQYGDKSYDSQKKALKRILAIINEENNTPDKFAQVRYEYKQLFFPKSSLSEFYIWNDNFLERKRINEALENIKSRLWEILR